MKNAKHIKFTLDGTEVSAIGGETIWQAAARHGTDIPHLCHSTQEGYRSDGNCRACMVEVEGERVLAASCIRQPSEGMVVNTQSEGAQKSRKLVFEMLAADQPPRDAHPDPDSTFWQWADKVGADPLKLPGIEQTSHDVSHPAMHVNLNACINCNLCVRACREVQVNDVIGMSFRGSNAEVTFDFDDPMGDSTCVACGECVQVCPTGALIEKSIVDEVGVQNAKADREVDTLCPYCGVGCQVRLHIKDDKILHVDGRNGPANNNRLCVKGRFGMGYVHNPDRLTVPLIRRDDAPKGRDIEIGPGEVDKFFREASWEEAMEVASKGFLQARKDHGPSKMCGFGSAKGSNEEAYLFQKLIRSGFGTNNVDHCTRLCHASSVAALMEGVGSGAVSAPFTAADDAECIIIIGARPNVNHPVAATYFKQAAKDGKKVIILDPRRNQMSRFAWKHLQFKAGSDVAMLNAILHTIVEEKLYDEQYIQSMTLGFEELREKVKTYAPEKMAAICGIEAETLREVARAYAKSTRSIIFWGMGISQHTHGTDNARCLIAMSMITGHVGRPGTGLHPLRGQNNVQGASDAGLIPMFYPDYQSVTDPNKHQQMESFWNAKLDPEKGLTVVEIIDAAARGEMKAMYVMGENPAMSDPDQNHAREGLARLEHLVVQDIFLTETAWHADVVLPASVHAEKNGTFTNTNRQIQMGRRAFDPPGEARQDWRIIVELANQLGLDWQYEHVSEVYTEMAEIMPSLNNISWERLDREECVTYPCDFPDKPGDEIVFQHGFPTDTGHAQIVPVDLLPPGETPNEDFPLILTTGRLLEHWHTGSMTRRADALDQIEPEAAVSMNAEDIKRLDLTPGQLVIVSTWRGQIKLVVKQDWELPQGLIFIPFCFAEAPANFLTNPQLDPYGKIPEFKFCAARIDPAEDQIAAE